MFKWLSDFRTDCFMFKVPLPSFSADTELIGNCVELCLIFFFQLFLNKLCYF